MSTIASPREPGPRRIPSSQAIATPTSSGRPSLDVPRSGTSSPSPATPNTSGLPHQPPRRNRAALREYYNLRNKSPSGISSTAPPSVSITTEDDQFGEHGSEVPLGDLDRPGVSPEDFVAKATSENSMAELLRLYTRILGETRALDAEKKALVYDNYSKLISATETIRKMRSSMDPLNPMASTLDPAIAGIYAKASSIRDALRQSIPPPDPVKTAAETEARQKRLRSKQLALQVLETPDKVRALVSEGRLEDARQMWKMPRRLLLVWKENGLGGRDIEACIRDGDAAVKGEPSKENWRDMVPEEDDEDEEEEDEEEEDDD